VVGAIVGGATALISGGDIGDIFEGALKGAAIAGVTAGVVSYAGIATKTFSAAEVLKATGAAPSAGVGAEAAPAGNPNAANILAGGDVATTGMSDAKALLLSGLGQGVSTGISEVGAAKATGEYAKEAAATAAAADRARIDANVAGEFQPQVADVKTPGWWDKYLVKDATGYKQPVQGYKQPLQKHNPAGLLSGRA
jgi:hypothetical protein